MRHICFLMPSVGFAPSGGFKVVFEYANRFYDDGYKVSIAFAASNLWRNQPFKERIKSIIRYFINKFPQRYTPYSWFNLNRSINLYPVWNLNERCVPVADIYVATAAETAIYLNQYKKVDYNRKFYLIQGYETWHIGESKLIETYKYNLKKIVIAPWLLDKIESYGTTATLIPNGFDFKYFRRYIDVSKKDKYLVTMLFHTSKLKGCGDAFKALEIVKTKIPQLHVNIFGFPSKPSNLPSWYFYYQQPNKKLHNEIYNTSAIYVGASYSEGFCLTPPEAMMCGCAVACTDIGGYKTVGIDGITALLSPVGDFRLLADNIIRLIENDELRYDIANNGYNYVQQFTWEKAYDKFQLYIDENY